MRQPLAKAFVLALCVGWSSAPATALGKSFDNFSELRAELLNSMGGAVKRIWLTTDFLTDGEIVTALYVAQYRKVDVRVLLGRAKAAHYMSRLNYLKNQNIPVYLRPDSFRARAPSAVLCDDALLEVDGELDFLSKYKRFNITTGDSTAAQAYAAAFSAAASLELPANARPLPLVGHQHAAPWPTAAAAAKTPPRASYLPRTTPHYDPADSSGAYTYDRRPTPRPEGVPAKLPKDLKYKLEQQRQQELERQRQEQERWRQEPAQPEPPPATTIVQPLVPAPSAGTASDSLIKSPVLKEDTEQGGD